jgi:hypothetical protein
MLNTAYSRIYAELVSSLDNFGTREIRVDSGSVLPKLLKTYDIYSIEGGDPRRLQRANGIEPEKNEYLIVDGTIYFNPSNTNEKRIRFQPQPVSITYPVEPQLCQASKINRNIVGFYNETAKKFVLTNVVNNAQVVYDMLGASDPVEWFIYSTSVVYLTADHVCYFGGDSQQSVSQIGTLFQDRGSGYAFSVINQADNFRWDYSFDGLISKAYSWDSSSGASPEYQLWYVIGNDHFRFDEAVQRIYRLNKQRDWANNVDVYTETDITHLFYPREYTEDFREVGFKRVIFNEPYVVVAYDDGSIWCFHRDWLNTLSNFRRELNYRLNWHESVAKFPHYELIDFDASEDSGLGCIYRCYGSQWLGGFTPDTALDFPLSVYYDWLKSELTWRMLLKARQPLGEFKNEADDYWQWLVAMKTRDINAAWKIPDARLR